MNLALIVHRPVMTEKSLKQSGASTRYAFIVDRRATKPQIKTAVAAQFGVSVSAVTTAIRKGATRRQLGRSRGRAVVAPTKKAVVTLEKGQTIDLLEVKQKP